MDKKITTVITAFEQPDLLKKAVASVLSQTYPHFTLWVYDNGNDDATYALMQEFLQADPRVHYYRHPQNIGMIKNYEYGFLKIETPYFSFLSQDDWLLPCFYETALKDLEQFPQAAFSVCAARVVTPSGQHLFDSLCHWSKKGLFEPPQGFLELLYPSFKPPIPTCALFNRNVIGQMDFDWSEEIQLLWDPDYLMRIAEKFPFFINDTICGFYLAHDEGYSSGFYGKLQNSSKGFKTYLKTVCRLIKRTESSEVLPAELKSTAKSLLLQFFRNHTKQYIRGYLKSKKFADALQALILWVYFLRMKPSFNPTKIGSSK